MESKTLLNKDDLRMFHAELACEIGANEAIALQQVHYWLKINEKADKNFREGKYWTYNTYDEWLDSCFPFWSKSTLRRTFKNLEKEGLLITGNFNKAGFDNTKWYSIDYEVLREIESRIYENNPSVQNEQTTGQNEQTDCPKRTDGAGQNEQANTRDLPETSKKNIYKLWQDIWQTTPNPSQANKLKTYKDELPLAVIKEAMQRTKDNADKPMWYYKYCKSILDRWVNKGVESMEDVGELDKRHEDKKKGRKINPGGGASAQEIAKKYGLEVK